MSAVQPASPAAAPSLELKHILVTTDLSKCSRMALKQAAAVARLHGSDVAVLHVVRSEPFPNLVLEPATWEQETILRELRDEVAFAEQEYLADVPHELIVETGPAGAVLEKIIKERDISLLVIGTHGRSGMSKLFLGSVAEQFYRIADCPVMTIGPDIEPALLTHGRFRSILFATDFSDGSKHSLPYAVGLARESGAQLTLLHVVEEASILAGPLNDQLTKVAHEHLNSMLLQAAGLIPQPKVEVVSGYPVEEILRVARKNSADLIVLGVHKASRMGARTSAHLPWTIAQTIVAHAKCPVLTVRG